MVGHMYLLILNSFAIALSAYFLVSFFSIKKTGDFILTWWLMVVAQIIFIETVLGIAGALYLENILFFQGMVLLSGLILFKKAAYQPPVAGLKNIRFIYGSKILIFALAVFLAFFLPKFWAAWIKPPLSADALSNHLTFPVTWLKNGNLNNPMLIFGTGVSRGVSQAPSNSVSYYPFNAGNYGKYSYDNYYAGVNFILGIRLQEHHHESHRYHDDAEHRQQYPALDPHAGVKPFERF